MLEGMLDLAAPDLVPPTAELYYAPNTLIEVTRAFADDVAAGVYSYRLDADERWHRRIYRDARMDVWLIAWLPDQGTQLHDHGGSSGSFTVLTGELAEASVTDDGALTDRRRAAGASVGFDAHYVHDVRNLADRPAVSVHAYSPPLTTMTYYDLDDGCLSAITSLATDDPEPDFAAADVRALRSAS